jgi:hypothetical protein
MIMSSTILLIVNPRAKKCLRITKGLKQQQTLIIIPPYWYGSNPFGFPMGTPMMPMGTNPMSSLLMLMWNPMMYPSMLEGVRPSMA